MNTRGGSLSLLQGALFNPGIELGSPALQAESLPLSYQGSHIYIYANMFVQISRNIFSFPDGSGVKNTPAMEGTYETQVQSLGWDIPLE